MTTVNNIRRNTEGQLNTVKEPVVNVNENNTEIKEPLLTISDGENGGLTVNEEDKAPQKHLPGNTSGNTPPDAASVKKAPEPLDLGHYDDDKIKISDGDIIEYIMKEWVEAGAAWILDKLGGFNAAILYQLSKATGKQLSIRGRQGINVGKSVVSSIYNRIDPNCNNMVDLKKQHEESINRANQLLTDSHKEMPTEMRNLIGNIGTDCLQLDGNKYKRYDPAQKKWIESCNTLQDLPKSKFEFIKAATSNVQIAEAYNILTAQGHPGGAKVLKELSKVYDAYAKSSVDLEISEKDRELINNNPAMTSAIKQARQQFHQNIDDMYRVSTFKIELDAQASLFAEYYSQYEINQEHAQTPNKRKFAKKNAHKRLGRIKQEKFKEAEKMFWQFQQARLNGQELPSNDQLIEMAKEQSQTAENNPNVEDKIYNQYYAPEKGPKVQNEPELTLQQTFMGYENVTSVLIKDLGAKKAELQALGQDSTAIDDRRKYLSNLKERIKNVSDPVRNPLPQNTSGRGGGR